MLTEALPKPSQLTSEEDAVADKLLQSTVQSFDASSSQVPQLSTVAKPAHVPAQSKSAVQLPSQSKFSCAYVHELSSAFASAL